jgi:hypothetical protein
VVGDPLARIQVLESPAYVFKEGALVYTRVARISDTRALMPLRLADPAKPEPPVTPRPAARP